MAEGPLSAPRALCDGGGQLSAANIDRESCMMMILVHDEEDLLISPQSHGGSNDPRLLSSVCVTSTAFRYLQTMIRRRRRIPQLTPFGLLANYLAASLRSQSERIGGDTGTNRCYHERLCRTTATGQLGLMGRSRKGAPESNSCLCHAVIRDRPSLVTRAKSRSLLLCSHWRRWQSARVPFAPFHRDCGANDVSIRR